MSTGNGRKFETCSNLNKRSFFIFWALFFLLNGLLYFQNFISFLEINNLLQGPTISAGSWTGRIHMLFGRNSYAILKISGEFLLLMSLFFWVKNPGKWWKRLLSTCFIFLFIYNIYFEFNQKFYGITPSFQNDYALLSEVLPIFLNSLTGSATFSYVLAIIFILLTGVFFIWLLRKLLSHFKKIQDHRFTRFTFIGLWLCTLIYSCVPSYTIKHQNVFVSQWMSSNFIKSMRLPEADKYKKIEASPLESYLSKDLSTKPNIYMLFIESYGTVITEAPEFKANYTQQIANIEKQLRDSNYHMASNYSISPVKGGRSWLAFSSLMSGLKVDNQIQYNDLIQRNFDYPNMVRYFNTQGYQTYRLSTISNVNSDSLIPYVRTNRYWDFDEWWTYSDFQYRGFQYDVLGGIPDQYALGYYRQEISSAVSKPTFLFYITMASHMPWYPPPPILEDWQDFNRSTKGKLPDLKGDDKYRYQQAIEYELELMRRFIIEESENSVFVLVGDHQPPGMEYLVYERTDLAATPIHIISKDSVLIDRFKIDGFQDGMQVDLKEIDYLRHDEFYGMFLDHLTKE